MLLRSSEPRLERSRLLTLDRSVAAPEGASETEPNDEVDAVIGDMLAVSRGGTAGAPVDRFASTSLGRSLGACRSPIPPHPRLRHSLLIRLSYAHPPSRARTYARARAHARRL